MKYILSLLFILATTLSVSSGIVTAVSSNDCVAQKTCVKELQKDGKVTIKRTDVTGLEKVTSKDIIKNVLNAVYAVTAIIAVMVIVVAGILYVVSDGDPARTTRAKNAVIYSVAGLVIVGSAFIITGIVQNIGAP